MNPLQHSARVFVISVLLGAHGAAYGAPAGVSVDPTRPPSPVAGVPGGERSAQSRTLQSVLIAPGRSVAVVDGEMVRVGSRLGDAEVVKIDEFGVVLRSGGRTEMLKLLPDAKRVGSHTFRHNTIEERVK
jgi:MSHA biogenesis protein MshK